MDLNLGTINIQVQLDYAESLNSLYSELSEITAPIDYSEITKARDEVALLKKDLASIPRYIFKADSSELTRAKTEVKNLKAEIDKLPNTFSILGSTNVNEISGNISKLKQEIASLPEETTFRFKFPGLESGIKKLEKLNSLLRDLKTLGYSTGSEININVNPNEAAFERMFEKFTKNFFENNQLKVNRGGIIGNLVRGATEGVGYSLADRAMDGIDPELDSFLKKSAGTVSKNFVSSAKRYKADAATLLGYPNTAAFSEDLARLSEILTPYIDIKKLINDATSTISRINIATQVNGEELADVLKQEYSKFVRDLEIKIVDDLEGTTAEVVAKVTRAIYTTTSPFFKIRKDELIARAAKSTSAGMTTDIEGNYQGQDKVIIPVGGYYHKQGKGAEKLAKRMQPFIDPTITAIIPVDNTFEDTKAEATILRQGVEELLDGLAQFTEIFPTLSEKFVELKEALAKANVYTYEQVKMVSTEISEISPTSVEIANVVREVRKKNPSADIVILGHSQGSKNAEDALRVTQTRGDYKTEAVGLGHVWPQTFVDTEIPNLSQYVGTKDPFDFFVRPTSKKMKQDILELVSKSMPETDEGGNEFLEELIPFVVDALSHFVVPVGENLVRYPGGLGHKSGAYLSDFPVVAHLNRSVNYNPMGSPTIDHKSMRKRLTNFETAKSFMGQTPILADLPEILEQIEFIKKEKENLVYRLTDLWSSEEEIEAIKEELREVSEIEEYLIKSFSNVQESELTPDPKMAFYDETGAFTTEDIVEQLKEAVLALEAYKKYTRGKTISKDFEQLNLAQQTYEETLAELRAQFQAGLKVPSDYVNPMVSLANPTSVLEKVGSRAIDTFRDISPEDIVTGVMAFLGNVVQAGADARDIYETSMEKYRVAERNIKSALEAFNISPTGQLINQIINLLGSKVLSDIAAVRAEIAELIKDQLPDYMNRLSRDPDTIDVNAETVYNELLSTDLRNRALPPATYRLPPVPSPVEGGEIVPLPSDATLQNHLTILGDELNRLTEQLKVSSHFGENIEIARQATALLKETQKSSFVALQNANKPELYAELTEIKRALGVLRKNALQQIYDNREFLVAEAQKGRDKALILINAFYDALPDLMIERNNRFKAYVAKLAEDFAPFRNISDDINETVLSATPTLTSASGLDVRREFEKIKRDVAISSGLPYLSASFNDDYKGKGVGRFIGDEDKISVNREKMQQVDDLQIVRILAHELRHAAQKANPDLEYLNPYSMAEIPQGALEIIADSVEKSVDIGMERIRENNPQASEARLLLAEQDKRRKEYDAYTFDYLYTQQYKQQLKGEDVLYSVETDEPDDSFFQKLKNFLGLGKTPVDIEYEEFLQELERTDAILKELLSQTNIDLDELNKQVRDNPPRNISNVDLNELNKQVRNNSPNLTPEITEIPSRRIARDIQDLYEQAYQFIVKLYGLDPNTVTKPILAVDDTIAGVGQYTSDRPNEIQIKSQYLDTQTQSLQELQQTFRILVHELTHYIDKTHNIPVPKTLDNVDLRASMAQVYQSYDLGGRKPGVFSAEVGAYSTEEKGFNEFVEILKKIAQEMGYTSDEISKLDAFYKKAVYQKTELDFSSPERIFDTVGMTLVEKAEEAVLKLNVDTAREAAETVGETVAKVLEKTYDIGVAARDRIQDPITGTPYRVAGDVISEAAKGVASKGAAPVGRFARDLGQNLEEATKDFSRESGAKAARENMQQVQETWEGLKQSLKDNVDTAPYLNFFDKITQQARGYTSEIWKSVKAHFNLKSILLNIGGLLLGGLGLVGAIRLVNQFGQESVMAAVHLESFQESLGSLNYGNISQLESNIDGLATRLQRRLSDVREEYFAFAQSAQIFYNQTNLDDIFEGLLTGTSRIGAEQQKNVFFALTQILNKQKVQAQELVIQYGQAFPAGLAVLARALGTTTDRLQFLGETGEVSANTLVEALGEEMAKIPPQLNTTQNFINLFQNDLLKLQEALGEYFLDILMLFKPLTGAVSFLADNLDSVKAAMELALIIGAATATKVMGGLLLTLVPFPARVNLATASLYLFNKALATSKAFLAAHGVAILKTVGTLAVFYVGYRTATSIFSAFTEGVKDGKKPLEDYTKALGDLRLEQDKAAQGAKNLQGLDFSAGVKAEGFLGYLDGARNIVSNLFTGKDAQNSWGNVQMGTLIRNSTRLREEAFKDYQRSLSLANPAKRADLDQLITLRTQKETSLEVAKQRGSVEDVLRIQKELRDIGEDITKTKREIAGQDEKVLAIQQKQLQLQKDLISSQMAKDPRRRGALLEEYNRVNDQLAQVNTTLENFAKLTRSVVLETRNIAFAYASVNAAISQSDQTLQRHNTQRALKAESLRFSQGTQAVAVGDLQNQVDSARERLAEIPKQIASLSRISSSLSNQDLIRVQQASKDLGIRGIVDGNLADLEVLSTIFKDGNISIAIEARRKILELQNQKLSTELDLKKSQNQLIETNREFASQQEDFYIEQVLASRRRNRELQQRLRQIQEQVYQEMDKQELLEFDIASSGLKNRLSNILSNGVSGFMESVVNDIIGILDAVNQEQKQKVEARQRSRAIEAEMFNAQVELDNQREDLLEERRKQYNAIRAENRKLRNSFKPQDESPVIFTPALPSGNISNPIDAINQGFEQTQSLIQGITIPAPPQVPELMGGFKAEGLFNQPQMPPCLPSCEGGMKHRNIPIPSPQTKVKDTRNVDSNYFREKIVTPLFDSVVSLHSMDWTRGRVGYSFDRDGRSADVIQDGSSFAGLPQKIFSYDVPGYKHNLEPRRPKSKVVSPTAAPKPITAPIEIPVPQIVLPELPKAVNTNLLKVPSLPKKMQGTLPPPPSIMPEGGGYLKNLTPVDLNDPFDQPFGKHIDIKTPKTPLLPKPLPTPKKPVQQLKPVKPKITPPDTIFDYKVPQAPSVVKGEAPLLLETPSLPSNLTTPINLQGQNRAIPVITLEAINTQLKAQEELNNSKRRTLELEKKSANALDEFSKNQRQSKVNRIITGMQTEIDQITLQGLDPAGKRNQMLSGFGLPEAFQGEKSSFPIEVYTKIAELTKEIKENLLSEQAAESLLNFYKDTADLETRLDITTETKNQLIEQQAILVEQYKTKGQILQNQQKEAENVKSLVQREKALAVEREKQNKILEANQKLVESQSALLSARISSKDNIFNWDIETNAIRRQQAVIQENMRFKREEIELLQLRDDVLDKRNTYYSIDDVNKMIGYSIERNQLELENIKNQYKDLQTTAKQNVAEAGKEIFDGFLDAVRGKKSFTELFDNAIEGIIQKTWQMTSDYLFSMASGAIGKMPFFNRKGEGQNESEIVAETPRNISRKTNAIEGLFGTPKEYSKDCCCELLKNLGLGETSNLLDGLFNLGDQKASFTNLGLDLSVKETDQGLFSPSVIKNVGDTLSSEFLDGIEADGGEIFGSVLNSAQSFVNLFQGKGSVKDISGLFQTGLDIFKMFGGSFDTGGIVPGALGESKFILAHGGETVLPTHKDPKMINRLIKNVDDDSQNKSQSGTIKIETQVINGVEYATKEQVIAIADRLSSSKVNNFKSNLRNNQTTRNNLGLR